MTALQATHVGELDIAGTTLHCAVLEGDLRVVSTSEMQRFLGMHRSASGRKYRADKLPPFLAAKSLKPAVESQIRHSGGVVEPVLYRPPGVGRIEVGYRAELITLTCQIYLHARRSGLLRENQQHIANRCEELILAFADVGLVALIDEATGYQKIRDGRALQDLLPRYLRPDTRPYEPMFPIELFQEIYRLNGWTWKGNNRHPQCLGSIFNWLFYDRMLPGLRPELCRVNPANNDGRRANRHHQHLSDDTGRPTLARMIDIVLSHAQTARTWEGFKRSIDIVLPRSGTQPAPVRAAIAKQLSFSGLEDVQ